MKRSKSGLMLLLLFAVVTLPSIPSLPAQLFTTTQTSLGDSGNSTLTLTNSLLSTSTASSTSSISAELVSSATSSTSEADSSVIIPVSSTTGDTVQPTSSVAGLNSTTALVNSQTTTFTSATTTMSALDLNVTQSTSATTLNSSTTSAAQSLANTTTTTLTTTNHTAFAIGNEGSNSTTTTINATSTTESAVTTQSTSATSNTTLTSESLDPTNWVLVSVGSNPSMSSNAVTVDGFGIITPHTYNWTLGSSHLLNANVSFTCGTGCQYTFSNWSDSGSQAHLITANSNETYTANFNLQYYLTTNASPSNGGTVNPSSGWFNSGIQVSLQAFTASGYQFASWTCVGSGCFSGSSSLATVTMNSPILELANLQQSQSGYSVTFQQNGLPAGVVWSILVDGNYYITSSPSITVTGLSGTVNYAYQGLAFGNYFYNQYYYLNCYAYQYYCYNNYSWYNQYFSSYFLNNPLYLNEYVCVYGCLGSVSSSTTATSNYVFYQTINQQTPTSTYTVMFQEYGLPAGSTWSVTVGGNSLSTSTNSITAYGLSGGVNYYVQNSASGYVCQSNCSGTVSGAATVPVNYGGSSYTVNTTAPVPEFSGLPITILMLCTLLGLLFVKRRRR